MREKDTEEKREKDIYIYIERERYKEKRERYRGKEKKIEREEKDIERKEKDERKREGYREKYRKKIRSIVIIDFFRPFTVQT